MLRFYSFYVKKKIPFGRVNHNKYLVTDQHAFVGTSNWSADYFISTGGIAFIVQGDLRLHIICSCLVSFLIA